MAGKFVLSKSKDNHFYFNLKAANGEIILTSEMYNSRASAMNGIESVKKNSPDDARYEKKDGKSGSFYFVLKAANHQVIGQSQQYKSVSGRDNGIESVKKNGPAAEVDDQTGD